MRANPCLLILAMALAGPAVAQSAGDVGSSECSTKAAAIERDMDLAQSKGQMLLRRQLAGELAALRVRCEPVASEQGRAATIERLEQEIRVLQTELEQAEEQLRKLKNATR